MKSDQNQCPIRGAPADFRDYLQHLGLRWVRCVRCCGGHKTPYIPEVTDSSLTEHQYDKAYLEPAFSSDVASSR